MKIIALSKRILGTVLIALLGAAPLHAEEDLADAIQAVRATYRADRQTFLTEHLRLTDAEAVVFWPLYREYRAEMEKLGDSLVKLVLEYADGYPEVPEDRAARMLKDYTALEEKLVKTRSKYVKRAAHSLPKAKVLRWAQLESRLDLGLRLQLAGAIPLVPEAKSAR